MIAGNKFIRSFIFAINGIAYSLRTQANMRYHIFTAIIVIALSLILKLSLIEWSIILICIAMVVSAELINTAIETHVDLTSPEKNDKAGITKDLSAAAVLIVSVLSAIVGLIIFIPKIYFLFAS